MITNYNRNRRRGRKTIPTDVRIDIEKYRHITVSDDEVLQIAYHIRELCIKASQKYNTIAQIIIALGISERTAARWFSEYGIRYNRKTKQYETNTIKEHTPLQVHS